MKRKKLIIFVLLVIFLSGCWDESEPERMLYVHGIGVDYKDGKYEIYSQIINFTNIAKSDQPSTNPVQSEIGHASGKTIDEAFFELYHSIDQKVFWGHFTYLVLSEEILKKGEISPIIDTFIRYRETRYQIWVYMTKDPVKNLLLTTPTLNKAITLSKLSDPMNSYRQESYIEPIDFRKLIIGLNEPSHEIGIPYVKITENWETLEGKNDATHLSGVGVISPNSFKGIISGEKARGLQWMTNKSERGEVTVKLKSDGEQYLTVVIDKIKAQVKPVMIHGEIKFDIDIKLHAYVSQIEGKLKPAQIQKGIESQMKKEIKETYEEALKMDIDIYRLSEKLYRNNLKAWKKHEEKGKITLTESSIRKITIDIQQINSGRKSLEETVKQ